MNNIDRVLSQVRDERERQDAKWGEQNHPDGTGGELFKMLADASRDFCDRAAEEGRLTWRHILREEYAEAIAEDDPAKLREELLQLAAVCGAWIEAIDRRAS